MSLVQVSSRLLLGANYGAPDEELAAGAADPHAHVDTTKNLRVAAIFIILSAGLIGGIPPLFLPAFRTPGHALPRLLRALSAGIILSLALIHIFPEAVLELAELAAYMKEGYEYNVAGATACFGVVLMVATESATHFFLERYMKAKAARKAAASKQQAVAEGSVCQGHTCSASAGAAGSYLADPHLHVCMGPAHVMVNSVDEAASVRDQVVASMFELGCIFHSFIIGLTLGVNTDNLGAVRSLTIALAFHQWLEGISLGSFIMRAQIRTWRGILMVIAYSVTCPVGIAIGIAIADSYDAESKTAIAVTGTFNGVSAGMLLYITLVQLIAEDFSRRELDPTCGAGGKAGEHGLPANDPVPNGVLKHVDSDGMPQAVKSVVHEDTGVQNGSGTLAHDGHHAHGHTHTHKHDHAHDHEHDHSPAQAQHRDHKHHQGHGHGSHSAGHACSSGSGGSKHGTLVFVGCHLCLLLGTALMGMLGIWA